MCPVEQEAHDSAASHTGSGCQQDLYPLATNQSTRPKRNLLLDGFLVLWFWNGGFVYGAFLEKAHVNINLKLQSVFGEQSLEHQD